MLSVQPSWWGSDEHKACSLGGIKCVRSSELLPDTMGLGSVDYCRSLEFWPACDPYPDWLPWGRRIYRGVMPDVPLFYKPADVPKRFPSAIMPAPPSGKWAASDPVEFVWEWRAYVVRGEVRGVFSYTDFESCYIPNFPWAIPKDITAAIDFGLTADGKMLPVEVNDPYAIGWYGSLSQYQIYADFVIAGWEYMGDKWPQ